MKNIIWKNLENQYIITQFIDLNVDSVLEKNKMVENGDAQGLTFIDVDYSQTQLDAILNPINLSESISNKLLQLDNYHYNSVEIRNLTVNNVFFISLTKDGRDFVAEQINQLEQRIKMELILEEGAIFEYFFGNSSVNITLVQLRQIYIEMLDIVNANFGIYQQEIFTINSLTTAEAVESYDFTTNYLKNNNFNL